jgi:predicted GNAT family acetyltransferase
MANVVRDNAALSRYELDVDGATAFTTYRRSPGTVTFLHTEVPPSLAGHGVGSALARGALEQVRARGEKVVAECPFIADYIAKHPDVQDLLVEPRPPARRS